MCIILFNLKLNCELEKKSTRNIKKYNPPIHWEKDLHKIRVGSKYLTFEKTVNPVPVNPEKDSKRESIIEIW